MIRPHRLKDGTTVYRVRVGSGPMRSFTRKRDAEEWEAKEKQNRLRLRAGLQAEETTSATFLDLCTLWEANFGPSAWTLSMLARPKEKWGRHQLQALRPEQLGAWLHALPLSSKTKSHILTATRAVLDAGVEWGYLTRNPARSRSFKAPSTKRQRPIRPFESWAEVLDVAKAVASVGDPVSSPLIRFACATGVRVPGELMAIRWNDIDWGRSELTVRGTKTDAAARIIPLSDEAIHALKDLPRSLAGGQLWMNQRYRGRLAYVHWRDHAWRKGLEEAGVEFRTPYEMRHTFATLALSAGAAIDDVASMMGHTDIDQVYRYYRKWIPQMSDRLRGVLNTIGKERAPSLATNSQQRPN